MGEERLESSVACSDLACPRIHQSKHGIRPDSAAYANASLLLFPGNACHGAMGGRLNGAPVPEGPPVFIDLRLCIQPTLYLGGKHSKPRRPRGPY
jgi:hypothetical protein